MLLRSVIINFLFTLAFLTGLRADEEIHVQLTTRQQLAPLYISNIHQDDSEFSSSYLKQLRKVFEFDLNQCGYSKVASIDTILEKALFHRDPSVAFNPERWGKASVSYVLKPVAVGKNLDLFIFNVKTNGLKAFEGIPLTGNFTNDRKQIHLLADAAVKTLFGVEGIASSQILYSVQNANTDSMVNRWKAEIWRCDYDGTNTKQVTQEKSYCITPVLATPKRYLYVSYKTGQPKIYSATMKNTQGKSFISLRGNQLLPALSKARDQMAFISDAGGRADLFLQKLSSKGLPEGKPVQLFSYPRSTQASPSFSPDGTQIAFVSDKDGTPRIYLIPTTLENNRRAEPVLITKENRENTCPTWSPDGTKLAYSAKTNGVRQIWIYDFEAREEKQFTTGPGNKENPCWAPNSLHLVFNSTDPDSSDLYLVNLNQPSAVKITKGPGKKHYPTWGK